MPKLTTQQAQSQVTLFVADMVRRGIASTEQLARLNGFLTCMCYNGDIDSYIMGDIYSDYEKHLCSDSKPMVPLWVEDLINRFKAYLAHDQYNRDKRTMMDGYLMALQHQRLIDPWQAYAVIQQYEKELANV